MKKNVFFLSILLVFGSMLFGQVKVDADLKQYQRVSNISGNLNSIGSDTLNNLMAFWAESFKKEYPNVVIQIEGKGSSTAPPALINGTAQLGPMSRPMKKSEIEKFEKKYGFKPLRVSVAFDALAIFLNKDNPLNKLSLQQVDAAFSSTRKGGLKQAVETWGDLGLKGEWTNKPLRLYGRNSASGTYAYFKKVALFKGDYASSVKEQPGSSAVVNAISQDKFGMGYSGIGFLTSGVKTASISKKNSGKKYAPNYANVLSNKYPLARALNVYIAKDPNKPLDPLTKEFIKFVLSKKGQEIVIKDGYLPLPAKVAEKQIQLLD